MEPQKKSMNIVLTVLLIVIFTIIALQLAGIINLSGFLNPNSEHYFDFKGIFHPDSNNNPSLCPITSADRGTPCCTTQSGRGIQPTVQSIYIPISCNCTTDTHFLQVAPEGNYQLYNICECNACSD